MLEPAPVERSLSPFLAIVRRTLFKPDHARSIDRCTDYFGETIGVPAECDPCRERFRGSES